MAKKKSRWEAEKDFNFKMITQLINVIIWFSMCFFRVVWWWTLVRLLEFRWCCYTLLRGINQLAYDMKGFSGPRNWNQATIKKNFAALLKCEKIKISYNKNLLSCYKRIITRWRHFTSTTSDPSGVVFFYKLELLSIKLQRDWQI